MKEENIFSLYVVATKPSPEKIAYNKAYYDFVDAVKLKESLNKLYGKDVYKIYKIVFSSFKEIEEWKQIK